jgi:hypothetical protein
VIREKSENSIEKAWVLMDQRKRGYFEMDDFRKVIFFFYLLKQK